MSFAPSDVTVLLDGNNARSEANQASYSFTLLATPSANHLIEAWIYATNDSAATPPTPTVMVAGVAMAIADVTNGVQAIHIDAACFYFRGMSASPSGTDVTVDFGADTQYNCICIVHDVANVNTSGTNGSGAIRNVRKNAVVPGTSLTVTLPAFGSADNGVSAGFSKQENADDFTLEAGYTAKGNSGNTFAEKGRVVCEVVAGEDTSVSVTTAASSLIGGIAAEIVAAAGGGGGLVDESGLRIGRRVSHRRTVTRF